MSEKKLLILNKKQISQKIDRMAYQVWEDNMHEEEIVIAGIADCGFTLAKRIKEVLERISGLKVLLMRISLDKNSSHLKASTDIPVEDCSGKAVVLADDVLNSGRTLAYGMGVFLNIPLTKLRTMVLVDRSHRIFPVSTDYTGLEISTVLREHVDVVLDDEGENDAVYLR
ncbi:phosphoribosyltransferase family protein [Hufsiella ginkgonis]|uniref:Phosphoribosyltransferase n=1 Tax=Hufsiella ginkgonis TaxID=2695274 RepID=A0A7K1Y1K6_9SPHI|nr:phosphoribosyltransferase family protein [Hufsiella ginkgonis]MXV17133.1 phosphoribosyltransferase [Hufsiella ginkgonis]